MFTIFSDTFLKTVRTGHLERSVLLFGVCLSLLVTVVYSGYASEDSNEMNETFRPVIIEKGVFYYDEIYDEIDDETSYGKTADHYAEEIVAESLFPATDTIGITNTAGATGVIDAISEIDEEILLAQNRPSRLLNSLSNRTQRPNSPLRPLQTPINVLREPILSTNPSLSATVRTVYMQLYDATRQRVIPLKIYYPASHAPETPVIIFSHGLGGSRESCVYLGDHWASNGYVVVFPQHAGSDDAVWRGNLRPLNALREAYEKTWTCSTRVADIIFVMEQLTSRGKNTDSLLELRMDMTCIGIAGYDMGAYTALLLAGQLAPEGGTPIRDPRIKAILAMSPPVIPTSAQPVDVYSGITIPGLFITGTEDNGFVGSTRAHQRRIPFDRILRNDQYLLTFNGTDHLLYAGNPFLSTLRNDDVYYNAIEKLSHVFWDAYLREDTKALKYLMSNNILGLTAGLGRLERKFYPRSELQNNDHQQEQGKQITPPPNPKAEYSHVSTVPIQKPYGAEYPYETVIADPVSPYPPTITPPPSLHNPKLIPLSLPTQR